MSTTERGLRRRLRTEPLPDADGAERRAWDVIRAAHAARVPQRPAARVGRLALALAAAALVAALLLSPAGARVRDWIGDAVEPGAEHAAPALTELPAPGMLLVDSAQGPWIVDRDGSMRLLGAYQEAAWSPSARFVAATSGQRLVAVVADAERVGEPAGTVRWTVTGPGPVSDPAWAPSGIRVAYLSGDELRVVAGDGTGDRAVAHGVAAAVPSWRPLSERQERRRSPASGIVAGTPNVLAYVDGDARIHIVDVDSRRELVRPSGVGPGRLRAIAWAPNGNQLWALTEHRVIGVSIAGDRLEPGASYGFRRSRPTAAIASPQSPVDVAALATRGERPADRHSRLLRLRGESMRVLSSGPGRFTDLAWSPDSHWLLLAWRDADQWLFIRPRDGRVEAVDNISEQFDPGGTGAAPFPRLAGWCCAR
jgi:hypothetical protein